MNNGGSMGERRQAMRDRREKMLVKMKGEDVALAAQLAQIKNAPEKQKMELLIAVVTRMVEERTVRHEDMAEMMDDMR